MADGVRWRAARDDPDWEIKDGLSDEILFGRLKRGGNVIVDLADDKLIFKYS